MVGGGRAELEEVEISVTQNSPWTFGYHTGLSVLLESRSQGKSDRQDIGRLHLQNLISGAANSRTLRSSNSLTFWSVVTIRTTSSDNRRHHIDDHHHHHRACQNSKPLPLGSNHDILLLVFPFLIVRDASASHAQSRIHSCVSKEIRVETCAA